MFMILLIVAYNLKGALIATAINSAIAGLVLVLFCLNKSWFRFKYWWGKTDKDKIIKIIQLQRKVVQAVRHP